MPFGIPRVSEQFTLALCSPPWPEERARKDAPNIGLSLHLGLLSKVGGNAIYAVKITSLKKFDITNYWHMERVYAHRQHQSWPERQTALTARELGRGNIHIAALSENTLSNKNSSGYTFFGAVATVKNVVKWERVFLSEMMRSVSVPTFPKDSMITSWLHATIISAYAPTMTNPGDQW